jgi:sphingolipid delta-4 desaturase
MDVSTEPHSARRRAILAAHPELRELFGPSRWTILPILLLVAGQSAVAILITPQPWWAILGTAYTLGAVANLGCWALVHEGGHNLIARSTRANRWWSMIANLPILVPAAAHFRFWHRHHHRRQGEVGWDIDLPTQGEVNWVGASPLRKALWLAAFMPLQTIRAFRAVVAAPGDRWLVANSGLTLIYGAALLWAGGTWALVYLLVSSWAAMGLHPLGARWVQEHFTVRPGQETTSYYGGLNWLVFNCGYHNEHHDLPGVPWFNLRKVRRTAPEFYEGLYATRSWTLLLWRFLSDSGLTLTSRVTR